MSSAAGSGPAVRARRSPDETAGSICGRTGRRRGQRRVRDCRKTIKGHFGCTALGGETRSGHPARAWPLPLQHSFTEHRSSNTPAGHPRPHLDHRRDAQSNPAANARRPSGRTMAAGEPTVDGAVADDGLVMESLKRLQPQPPTCALRSPRAGSRSSVRRPSQRPCHQLRPR